MKWFTNVSIALLALSFFLLNPLFLGCGEEAAEDYTFGAEEMNALVAGDWTGTIANDGGDSVTFELTLNQADDSTEAQQDLGQHRQPLCGSRTLVASAEACVATSEMPLVGEITIEGEAPQTVEGNFMVVGRHLTGGELHFETEDDHFNIIITEDEDIHEGSNADSKAVSIGRPS